jgi:hypothetical protein
VLSVRFRRLGVYSLCVSSLSLRMDWNTEDIGRMAIRVKRKSPLSGSSLDLIADLGLWKRVKLDIDVRFPITMGILRVKPARVASWCKGTKRC